jgi:CubicO group peptidase (beta-lactamase class C family)
MSRFLALSLAVLALAAGCTSDVDTPAQRAAPACDPALDAWAARGFSGAVVVSGGRGPGCRAGYGEADHASHVPNTDATVFRLGSVTKAFTAAAVLDLAEDGALALDDRAGDLVPGLAGPAAGVTVAQLLDHTSGLTGAHAADGEPMTRDEAVAAISRLESAFPPGTGELYSNAGYTLLALVVEARTGTTYRDHLATHVLTLAGEGSAGGFWSGEPAAPGPRATGYTDGGAPGDDGEVAGGQWAVDGNGGLAMSARDLAAWTHALFTGPYRGRTEAPGWGVVEVGGERVLAAAGGGDGSGHNAVAAWLPAGERAVVVLSNTTEITAEVLARAILPALAAGDPLPSPAGGGSGLVDPAVLDAAAGTYRLDAGGTLTVTAAGDGLVVAPRGVGAVAALFPLPDGVSDADARGHEGRVGALLAGETREGRQERQTLEADLGPIARVDVLGTVAADGELRTFVTVTGRDGTWDLWYAVDGEGGLAAAEVTDGPPTLTVVPATGGAFRPDDPGGAGPDVAVRFAADTLTVAGPRGTTVAQREP